MPHSFLRSFHVNHGTLGSEVSGGTEDLYATPQELEKLYGCCLTEEDIRAAMALINNHTSRPSFWPTEYDSGNLEIPVDRIETRLPITPVIQVLELAGRFGLGRRDRQSWNGLQAVQAQYLVMLGGMPQWQPIDLNQCELDMDTGVLYVQPSWVLAPYTMVRAKYIAGFVTIPTDIKFAIIEVCNTMHTKGMSERTRYAAGKVSRTYAGDSFITSQARQLLAKYVIQNLF